MKIYAINGSPRKKWNCALLLESFINGVKSVEPDAEVKMINVYDYNFTGCRSCFGCKLKTNPVGVCAIKDDIYELLQDVRTSDGIVFGAPVYFGDVSGQLRCFVERLLYPGNFPKVLPSAFLYAMNATEEMMEGMFRHNLNTFASFVGHNFKSQPDQVFSHDTYQRDAEREHLYRPSHSDMNAKKLRRETQFPHDLEAAFQAGVKMVNKINEVNAE